LPTTMEMWLVLGDSSAKSAQMLQATRSECLKRLIMVDSWHLNVQENPFSDGTQADPSKEKFPVSPEEPWHEDAPSRVEVNIWSLHFPLIFPSLTDATLGG